MNKADNYYRRRLVPRLARTPLGVVLLAVFLCGGDGNADMYSPEQAVKNDDVSIVSQLLKWGAIKKEDMLGIAAIHDSEHVARLLIEHGADINARDGADWTSLHMAERHTGSWNPPHIEKRRKQIVVMLRAAGAQTTAYEIDPDEYNVPYLGASVPGGYSVTGSFTTPGAEERLVIERLSVE